MKHLLANYAYQLIKEYSPGTCTRRIFNINSENRIIFEDYGMTIIEDGMKLVDICVHVDTLQVTNYKIKTIFGSIPNDVDNGSTRVIATISNDSIINELDNLMHYLEHPEESPSMAHQLYSKRALRDNENLYKIISCDEGEGSPFKSGEECYVYGVTNSHATILIIGGKLIFTNIVTLPVERYITPFENECVQSDIVLIRYHDCYDKLHEKPVYHAVGLKTDWYPDERSDPREPLFQKVHDMTQLEGLLQTIRNMGSEFYEDYSITDGTVVKFSIGHDSIDEGDRIIRKYIGKVVFAQEYTFPLVMEYLKTRDDIKFQYNLTQNEKNPREWAFTGEKIFNLKED